MDVTKQAATRLICISWKHALLGIPLATSFLDTTLHEKVLMTV
jgi:hypothetical protein